MEFKPKNRDWVKNAAIVFLSVLLVLTFFSNTWMNRSLPEVATQYVTNGSITAKVRGTGTVSAVGTNTVKAEQTREIRAVMVKVGQEVQAGDVLFVLGQGEASELEAAQENLRQLQLSYQRSAVNVPSPNYALEEKRIADAQASVETARAAMEAAAAKGSTNLPTSQLQAANNEVNAAAAALQTAKDDLAAQQVTYDTYKKAYDDLLAETQAAADARNLADSEAVAAAQAAYSEADAAVTALTTAYDIRMNEYQNQKLRLEQGESLAEGEELIPFEEVDAMRIEKENAELLREQTLQALAAAQAQAEQDAADGAAAVSAVSDEQVKLQDAKVKEAEAAVAEAEETLGVATEKRDAIQATIDEILGQDGVSAEYAEAQKAYKSAQDTLFELQYSLQEKKVSDSKSQQLSYLDLADIGQQIEKAKEKVNELSGGEENQILAKVAGTILSVDCAPGDTKLKDDVLCTIEVPDMGYTMSFSVTNDQARRLKPGDTATVSNYYWGNQIVATLESIKTDPKNPQTNKLLTFDLSGDVTAGSELTISVGQKSANYDIIVPNSAIRSDTNGSFVLSVESKNSPLGNRYIARRVEVTVLAEDDVNSAVTADLGYGDYVITTSNAPVKNGDMVRLADNT